MKINKLTVQGFRSLKDVTWEPGDLNVVIGPNASGKSNLLKLLELVSTSAQGRLAKHIQSQGGVSQVIWDGRANRIYTAIQCVNSPFNYTYDFSLDVSGVSYVVGTERLLVEQNPSTSNYVPRPLLERSGFQYARLQRMDGSILDLANGSYALDETILSAVPGPIMNETMAYPVKRSFASWHIYHNLDTGSDSEIRRANVARYEPYLDQDGQNLVPVLHSHYTTLRDFKKSIDLGMRAAYGDEYEELIFAPAADQLIQLRIAWKSLKRPVSSADLSDGTLKFLSLLAALLSPVQNDVIAIDEPETGLHPGMLPIIAEYAVEASKKTQVIFTTHSPQFLDAFHEARPTVTVAKWEDGETKLTIPDGESLSHWLQEYSLGTLFKTGELENMA
jgi:predicted ATPase